MFDVNEYFGGKVKSLSFVSNEGPATVGVMAEGEYEFGTSTVEHMTVTSGVLTVLLPGSHEWKDYCHGQTFVVESGVKFKVKTKSQVSYLCLYK